MHACRSAASSCWERSSPSSFRTLQGERQLLHDSPHLLLSDLELIPAPPAPRHSLPPALSPLPTVSSHITLLHSRLPSCSLPKAFSPCSARAPAMTRRKGWPCTRSSRSLDCLLVSGELCRRELSSGLLMCYNTSRSHRSCGWRQHYDRQQDCPRRCVVPELGNRMCRRTLSEYVLTLSESK